MSKPAQEQPATQQPASGQESVTEPQDDPAKAGVGAQTQDDPKDTETQAPAAGADEDPEDEETADDEPELSAAELAREVERLRKEAGKYRVRSRDRAGIITGHEATIADLKAQLEAAKSNTGPDPLAQATARAEAAERRAQRLELATELGVSPAALKAVDALHAAGDEATLKTALEGLAALLSKGAAATDRTANPTPPEGNAAGQSFQERLAAATTADERRKIKAEMVRAQLGK